MKEMIDYIEEGGLIVPQFKEITAQELTDDTVICTLEDLIDVLGEERGLNLYADIKTMGAK